MGPERNEGASHVAMRGEFRPTSETRVKVLLGMWVSIFEEEQKPEWIECRE